MPLDQGLVIELERATKAAGDMAQKKRESLATELKPDGSIVTNADRDVETFLRKELGPLVPGATFWGEEFGFDEPDSETVWLIDPVDGTTNFAFGQPLWGVTVALMQDGRLEAGTVFLPDLGWSFRAGLGDGAFMNGNPLDPVEPGPIKPFELVGQSDDKSDPFDFLPGKRRHYGSFVVEGMFLARHYLRAMTSTKVKLYDAAGCLVVLRELGLEVRTKEGCLFDEAHWLRDVRCEPFAMVPRNAWPWETMG